MKTPLQRMDECLDAKESPSYDLLTEVIAQCLSERNTYEQIAKDMGHWMSSMVTAHLFKDSDALTDILNEFIRTRVKMQSDQTTPLH